MALVTPTLDAAWSWKSWVDLANKPDCGYPLQNLPFCAFAAADGVAHLGAGIGDLILDLHHCAEAGLLHGLPDHIAQACTAPVLNGLMAGGRGAITSLRHILMDVLRDEAAPAVIDRVRPFLRPMQNAVFQRAVNVGNYTDFYASVHHATNVGRLFRPDQPLLPNYKYVPIGYHGRASSIIVSETPVSRPWGQSKPASAAVPAFALTQQLDYEVEMGAYIGVGNALGRAIDISDAEQHIFGFSLVNDWSARDIQAWEYAPLGPFLGKSFATTVSPWVVTTDALAPFRAPLASRSPEDPEPLPYLRSPNPATEGFDLQVEVHLSTAVMREQAIAPMRLSSANLRELYWSFAQMVTHHTSNGCNLLAGDLLASGTISGPVDGTFGSLLEITRRGAAPLALPTGETRSFLEDGDEVILSGVCCREGLPRISLGECRGRVMPPRT